MRDTVKCSECGIYYSDKHDNCPNPKCENKDNQIASEKVKLKKEKINKL